MSLQKECITVTLLIGLLCSIPTPVAARSVYAIPNHRASTANVYDISEGQLEYRSTYDLSLGDPADITIDTQSNTLFVTSEFERRIELINARTFLSEGLITAPGASDLTGVVMHHIDPNTARLYTVDRGTNKLFVYDWDADECYFALL